MLELATEAKVPYSDVHCGSATWQGGIDAYAGGGAVALRARLEDRGVQNIEALNTVLATGARSWSSFTFGTIGARSARTRVTRSFIPFIHKEGGCQ